MAVSEAGLPKSRDRWASRWVFILASIGAAVGLGNVWRFPALAQRHGGGSFLIPYVVTLVTTGLPLLQAEIALGAFTPTRGTCLRSEIAAEGAVCD